MKYLDRTTRRAAAALFWLLLGAACDEALPTGPSVSVNQEFTLAPGDDTTILGTSLRLQFVGVSGDSRCPADALCIQAGDALVHIVVRGNTSGEYDLHTADPARAVVRHDGVRIVLVSLQPYPFNGRGIQPEDYRATFAASQ